MSASHQGINQRNTGAGFARASGHNEQEVTLFLLNSFKDRANGPNLIIAPGNSGVDQLPGERLAAPANILEPLKVITGGETDNLSGRIVVEIPEKDLKTIGIKTERNLNSQLPLNMNTILPRLFPANGGITACFFASTTAMGLPSLPSST